MLPVYQMLALFISLLKLFKKSSNNRKIINATIQTVSVLYCHYYAFNDKDDAKAAPFNKREASFHNYYNKCNRF